MPPNSFILIGADQALANALPQIIWTCDAQGELEWVNDRWFELTGLTQAETLKDKGALAAVHPDDHAELWRHWTHALETSTATEFEYRIRDTSGAYRWHVARVAPVRDAEGEIIRWVAGVLDIHERRMAEDALRSSEHRFDSFFTLCPLAMAITRQSDGAYVFVNDAFTQMTGYSREEAVGRTPMELGMMSADTRAAAASHFSGGPGRTIEIVVRNKDGRQRTLLLCNSHIEVDGVPCFMNAGTDITDRRAMEDALRESEAQARTVEEALQRANRQKDEFISLLSHELRNPLTPILASARLLETRADAESRREVDVIVRQVKHVSRLVDDLLDVARIARGAVSLSKTRLEPATALARAVAGTAPLFEQRAQLLELDVPEHGLLVDADEIRLTQIFDNLLSNAARYTPHGGTIWVSGRRVGDLVLLRFRDTGRGIDASLLPDLFETFNQGPQGAERAEGGLGVGLSLVRALTELHGGTVTVHSDGPGLGTEFIVRLPAAAANPWRSPEPSRNTPWPTDVKAKGKRVLVIDDNRDIADGLSRLLRAMGYDVRAESNPLDAVAVAEAFRPDIALLDIGLPGLDGYGVAANLRARLGRKVPVLIALSGYNQIDDLRRSRAAGFAMHLSKPVDIDVLGDALKKFT